MINDRDIPTRRGDPAIRGLLQSLLATELLAPSPELYLISPWVTDFSILDNRSGQFRGLVPHWGLENITFSKVLLELARMNSEVLIATRPSVEANPFISAIQNQPGITLCLAEELHEKGLLTNEFYFAGSFNFTTNCIVAGEEVARLTIDDEKIAKKLLDFHDRWRKS